MTVTIGSKSEGVSGAKFPRRDWILLPMLSLLTITLILVFLALTAGQRFPNPVEPGRPTLAGCLILDDPSTGVRAIPNCSGWAGVYESGPALYKFNSCGHRAGVECGPKPEGTYRIVLLGTSTALGWSLPREKTFAAKLPQDLTKLSGRKVEVYNEAMMWQSPLDVLLSFKEVLAEKPDLILWVIPPTLPLSAADRVAPHDDLPEATANERKGFLAAIFSRVQDAMSKGSISEGMHYLTGEFQASQTQFMLQHFLYESQSQFVTSYLRGHEAAFLRTEPTPEWQTALKTFDGSVAKIADQSKAVGIPLVVVMAPYRAQAAMIAMGEWPAGYDPFKLDGELRAIVSSHGETYLSILPDYRSIANPEKDYFPIDGHPTAEGHAVLSRFLAKELTGGAVPALNPAAQPHSSPAQER